MFRRLWGKTAADKKVEKPTSKTSPFSKFQLPIEKQESWISALSFSPQGLIAYSVQEISDSRQSTSPNKIFIYDPTQNKLINEIPLIGVVAHIEWIDEDTLIYGLKVSKAKAPAEISHWDAELGRWDKGKGLTIISNFDWSIRNLMVLTDSVIVTVHENGEILFIDISDKKNKMTIAPGLDNDDDWVLTLSTTPLQKLALSQEGRLLILGIGHKEVSEYDFTSSKIKSLFSLAFSDEISSWRNLAFVSADRIALHRVMKKKFREEVVICDLQRPNEYLPLLLSKNITRNVKLTPLNANRLAVVYEELEESGNSNKVFLNIFDTTNGQPLYSHPVSLHFKEKRLWWLGTELQVDPRNLHIAIPFENGQILEFDWEHHLKYLEGLSKSLEDIFPRDLGALVKSYLFSSQKPSGAKVEEVPDEEEQNQPAQDEPKHEGPRKGS